MQYILWGQTQCASSPTKELTLLLRVIRLTPKLTKMGASENTQGADPLTMVQLRI